MIKIHFAPISTVQIMALSRWPFQRTDMWRQLEMITSLIFGVGGGDYDEAGHLYCESERLFLKLLLQ